MSSAVTVNTNGSSFTVLQTIGLASILLGVGIASYTYLTAEQVVGMKVHSGFIDEDKKVLVVEEAAPRAEKTVSSSSTSTTHSAPNSIKARLADKQKVSPDTVMLTFVFPNGDGKVIPVGKHLKVFCPNPNPQKDALWNGAPDPEAGKPTVERKYTPVSSTEQGFVLVVKAYRPNEKFASGGKVSQYLADREVGDDIEVAMPFGIMEYLTNGNFKKSKSVFPAKFVGMVAGGSGITPMLRLLEASLADDTDPTKFSLIFANRSEHDIILRSRLDELAKKHSNRFKVAYTLTRPPEGWKGGVGLVTQDMIKQHMPPNHESTLILCCGPPQMIKTCCKDNLERLGYSNQQIWDF